MSSKKAANLKKLAKDIITPKADASATKPVQSPVIVEVETRVKPVIPALPSKEANLKKLAESSTIADFVKSKDGCWNHEDWLTFLADLKAKGCDPIDPEQVGLLLEEKKAQYLAARS